MKVTFCDCCGAHDGPALFTGGILSGREKLVDHVSKALHLDLCDQCKENYCAEQKEVDKDRLNRYGGFGKRFKNELS